LATHPEKGSFTWAIAGRSTKKLGELAKQLGLLDDVEIFEVDVTNYEQVEVTVKKAKLVINTVGPFQKWGTPVVKACAIHGIHYIDITGETKWIREIITKYVCAFMND
jgi:short subunit dehydrogenase-like uncharacterized protein